MSEHPSGKQLLWGTDVLISEEAREICVNRQLSVSTIGKLGLWQRYPTLHLTSREDRMSRKKKSKLFKTVKQTPTS